ncbi:gap junction Cx32.2 protein-like [Neoarius graeffei]|uniref:gap junction Cx32.2 protein-like n=1 Tax=Neoarius graeffei TaxID=443677 RepID=UPI00298BEDC4|nr:gap junction Cx32.2 protein-like [Neoarius graeffei]
MGEWGFLSKLLDKVQSHSTVIGKLWMTMLFIFRIMVNGAGAEKVWGDEQSKMVCNTKQPGCTNVCYDQAFPISHIHFWTMQIIFMSTPALMYLGHIMHIIHKENKLRNYRQSQSYSCPNTPMRRGKVEIKGDLLASYLTSMIFKILLEAAFIVGQYCLYGFVTIPKIRCTQYPCSYTVECFMSRPTEKTVFFIFMLVMSCVSLLLNVIEMFYLICRRSRRCNKA